MGIESPRIGLLNIGEEPEKGDERAVEAHRLLAAAEGINFVGNIEGRDVIRGRCDVLVCDGFVGNVLLKFYESVAGFMLGMLREEMTAGQRWSWTSRGCSTPWTTPSTAARPCWG